MVCMRKEITILNRTDLVYFDSNGRIVAVKMNTDSTPLLIIGTYWPRQYHNCARRALSYAEASGRTHYEQ